MPRYRTQQIVESLRASKGMVSVAARRLGCTRKTISTRMKRSPQIADELYEQREMSIDMAEVGLMAAVQKGEAWAICFLLKTIGKSRGYSERFELQNTGEPLVKQVVQTVNIYEPDHMSKWFEALSEAQLIPEQLIEALDVTPIVNGTNGHGSNGAE